GPSGWRRARRGRFRGRGGMIARLEAVLRAARRWLSRSHWGAVLLRRFPAREPGYASGLVLIQIDGLSHVELKRALAHGRMPFLRRLIRREGYALHEFYSGVPSTTAAVQGELFYGVKTAVPSF